LGRKKGGGSSEKRRRETNVKRGDEGEIRREKEQLDVEGKSPTSTWLRVDGSWWSRWVGLCSRWVGLCVTSDDRTTRTTRTARTTRKRMALEIKMKRKKESRKEIPREAGKSSAGGSTPANCNECRMTRKAKGKQEN